VDLYFRRSREARRDDLSFYRGEIIDILIDRMLGMRFEEDAAKPQTPYVYAAAGTVRYAASSRFYIMTAQAKTGGAEESLAELLRAKESMLRYGFTAGELAVASESLLSDLRRLAQEKDRQESGRYVDSLVDFYLEGGNLADIEWELDAVQRLLPHIGAGDIDAAVKDYFGPGDIQVFIFAPEAELASLPGEALVRRMVKESPKMKIAPPESKAVEEGFLPAVPQRGEIISESADDETGAVIWELGNGARVILKPTYNKNDEIVMQAMARGGTSSAAPQDYVSAGLAVEMVQVSGLGPWPRPELARKLAGKQVSLSYSISSYFRGFRGSATSGDLGTLFEMLYLSFTDPRIDTEAVKAMMDQYATSLARRGDNPGTVFGDEISRIVYGGHPYFKPLEIEDLPKADSGTALAFVKKSLNPADFTFIFTGNLDTAAMRGYAETYLASIPAGESWNSWTALDFSRPGKTEKDVYKGMEEQSRVYIAWFAAAPFTEELSVTAQVLSEYLDIRMTEEIREKLGGVYSISVNVPVSPVPSGELSMQVYFACDPRRVRELSQAVTGLLDRTASEAVDPGTFSKAVEALKMEWETSMQSNAYIAQSYANSSVLLNLPLSRLDRRPQYYDAVSPAGIQRICSMLLQGGNGPAQVVLYPER
ncbi:MAG: insulinase family protein, partial [Treponema sp.]|nr:insulinase family protein [Treponema sp.]